MIDIPHIDHHHTDGHEEHDERDSILVSVRISFKVF